MKKFVAVVKREYIQRVRSKMFLGVTLLGPLAISLFGVVPMLIFQIKAGGPVRVAVVDETGKMYSTFVRAAREDESDAPEQQKAGSFNSRPADRMRPAQSDENFEFEEVQLAGRSIADVKSELNQKLQEKSLDGYLVLPANLFEEGVAEYYGSNTGDLFTREHLEDALSQSVREQRLSAANIDVEIVKSLSRPVSLQAVKVGAGEETSDSGEGFALVFATGFITYLTILMYGQIVLGAVIEEKETRIAEILFSSVKPMTLMLGKLIGVSFVALTQLAIWGVAAVVFKVLGAGYLASSESPITLPAVPAIVFVYFGLFFLLGYFIYSTMYALVGSMVTTAQEGGQLAMPIVLLLVIGFYLAYPVLRSPDSNFAVVVSMVPFFSPITMLVRIVTQTPPFWQIFLSLAIGFATVMVLTWLAGRIYRMGMLMYGKKASIPEALHWLRRA
jgi:ABC-2 type transport system permease protein